MDYNSEIDGLAVQAFSQDALEAQLSMKANKTIAENENRLDARLLEKENSKLEKLTTQLAKLQSKDVASRSNSRDAAAVEKIQAQIADCKATQSEIIGRILERQKRTATENEKPNESHADSLLKSGTITTFERSSISGSTKLPNGFPEHQPFADPLASRGRSHQNIHKRRKITSNSSPHSQLEATDVSSKMVAGFEDDYEMDISRPRRSRAVYSKTGRNSIVNTEDQSTEDADSESSKEWLSNSGNDSAESEVAYSPGSHTPTIKAKKSQAKGKHSDQADDGDENVYQARLKNWIASRRDMRHDETVEKDYLDEEEWHRPHPRYDDISYGGSKNDEGKEESFRLPGDIAQSLFDYQKTGVRWLWDIYRKRTGGILGDEMGLGKTIQMISFIAGLHYSKLLDRPVIVIAPATVLKQWANEFRKWWPPMRVSILHSTGSGMMNVKDESDLEKRMDGDVDALQPRTKKPLNTRAAIAAQRIVERVIDQGHVLITTYAGLQIHGQTLLPVDWQCAVLDEGHRIRNPDALISLCCKQIKSTTRIILSGTPIQNSLVELWSLFDFVYPGKLGVLPVFKQQIELPIRLGGYSSASNVQVQAAYKCAVVLKEIIDPFILRRFKSDVAILPDKQDLVLFCNPVQKQKDDYEAYLKSKDVGLIFEGKRDMLAGIDVLRKICNHPDLADRNNLLQKPGYKYGSAAKSGKMQIVKGLLKTWQGNSKCLIFSQGTQMLDILERLVQSLDLNYLRMDGGTPIGKRQDLVDEFNNNAEIMVFLLTTRVGGLGVNLTGASRVIIYDPDWNPSHDVQARERSWRLGQKKDVKIYRLLVRGTIEEKIYQRQLFKQFLSKKVLENPHQRRLFKLEDMHDLFTFGSLDKGTETGQIFEGLEKPIAGSSEVEDVQKINGVDRLEPNANERPHDALGTGSSGGGDPLLEGILAQAGVHSILPHDEIIEGAAQAKSMAEVEATRIANNAIKALEESSRLARRSEIGAITWTGRSGAAGKDISAGIRKPTKANAKRTQIQENTHHERQLSDAQLRMTIIRFFQEHKGDPKSKDIANFYNTGIPSNIASERFRSCLKDIASFNKELGIWRLIQKK